nr:MAG TPA: putative exonuclease [Caudoviricetes sp.]
MVNKGTSKPYVKCIGASSTGVTQSCYFVRFNKYCILLDCGGYQESDIWTNYQKNLELLKKIKPREVDWIILHECHIDHTMLVPSLYARGCQAHLIVPKGSTLFLKLLWEDSMKIFMQDCQKLEKTGKKASPFYTQEDIETTLNRIIEIDVHSPYQLAKEITLTYYNSNHIIHACQLLLEMKQGYTIKRLGFTGDLGSPVPQPYVNNRDTIPYCNLLLSENTYNKPQRVNKAYDRGKDLEKIQAVLEDSKNNRVLIPCFSLNRTQTILTELYLLWEYDKIPHDVNIIVDSPLAQKFCNIWPKFRLWEKIMNWPNLRFIKDWEESQEVMHSNFPCVILSASGFLNGGRVVEWLKAILPNRKNTIMFCGYSGQNNLASQIRSRQKSVVVNGDEVSNDANLIELVSFSSHASYEELLDYLSEFCIFDKVALVHGDMNRKPQFANTLQQNLIEQGKSSRVIATNMDSKIYI